MLTPVYRLRCLLFGPAKEEIRPYRMWNLPGLTLYIGISNAPTLRLGQHLDEKPWAHEIATWSIDRWHVFTDRAKAERYERRCIRRERPLYNVEFNRGNPTRVARRGRPGWFRQWARRTRYRTFRAAAWSGLGAGLVAYAT